jgi:hypothetical protein
MPASNRALREALDIEVLDQNHAAAIAAIAATHPHAVVFRHPHDHDGALCLPYALGLSIWHTLHMVVLEGNRNAAWGEWRRRLIGAPFANWLLDKDAKRLRPRRVPKPGMLIMYFTGKDWKHAGRVVDGDVVISKWGTFPVYEHPTWQVPWRYGLRRQYFDMPSRDEAIRLFEEHNAELEGRALGRPPLW